MGKVAGKQPSLDELFSDLREELVKKSHYLWEDKIVEPNINQWLSNFNGKSCHKEKERVIALYLLSKFVFISAHEINYLCKMMYHGYLHHQIINRKVITSPNIDREIVKIIKSTRFYGIGRPSESGSHILYQFRQMNNISLDLFIDPLTEHDKEIESLCLVDDVSLTGNQAKSYSSLTKRISCNERFFLTLLATAEAKRKITDQGFTVISPIIIGDDELRLGDKSPAIIDIENEISGAFSRDELVKFISDYGSLACPEIPSGYGGLALLLGLAHNVPDGTIPIIWSKDSWLPIFERHSKSYEVKMDDTAIFV